MPEISTLVGHRNARPRQRRTTTAEDSGLRVASSTRRCLHNNVHPSPRRLPQLPHRLKRPLVRMLAPQIHPRTPNLPVGQSIGNSRSLGSRRLRTRSRHEVGRAGMSGVNVMLTCFPILRSRPWPTRRSRSLRNRRTIDDNRSIEHRSRPIS